MLYVSLLSILVAAAKQDDDGLAFAHEIEPIARPVVDAHFEDAIPHTSCVPEITQSNVRQADIDTSDRAPIMQTLKPSLECRTLDNLDQDLIVNYSSQFAKRESGAG